MRKLKLLLATCALLGGAFSANAQTNLIAGWDGGDDTSSPSNFGWTSSANRTLNARNASSGIRMTTTYSGYKDENSNNYTYSATSDLSSVIFWVRYNTSGESFTYTFQGLEPNYYYDFSALLGWQNNSDAPTFTVKINDGTSDLGTVSKYISDKQKMYSVTTRFKTPSTITNTTDIKIVFTCNKTGDCIEAISALSLVNVVVKDELQAALTYANRVNTALSNTTLASAITTAQGVYDNASATQAQVNEAASTLNTAVVTALGDAAPADMSFVINNPGFENCTVTTTNAAAVQAASPLDISGDWTQINSAGWSSSAVVAYGGSGQVNGASAPSTDNAGNSGNSLGISVGWSGTVTYQSPAMLLPAGTYTLRVNGYNANTDGSAFTSKFGFVPTTGEANLSTKTSFTANTWETDEVIFTLSETTEGKIQVGGQAPNAGSGSNAKVFFDNITLAYENPFASAITAWNTAHTALDALDETALPDAAETAITTELAKDCPNTQAEIESATADLQALIDSYDAIKAAYDKVNDLITLATAEKTNSVGTTTDIEAAISTATTNIETRTTADALTGDYNTLETARQTYVISGAIPTDGNSFDWTFILTNPDFEDGTDGWTIVRNTSGNHNCETTEGAMQHGTKGLNVWANQIEKLNVYQELTLPAGAYELSAYVYSSNPYQQHVYANNGKDYPSANLTANSAWQKLSSSFNNYEEVSTKLGLYSQGKNQNNNSDGWFRLDNFQLLYMGTKPILNEAISNATDLYNGATANMGTGVFQIPSDAGTELNTAITAAQSVYNDDDATASEVEEAIDDLNEAITDFQNAELNAPDENKRYWLTIVDNDKDWDGNAITFIAGGRSDQGNYGVKYLTAANANLNQALKFTATTGNKYKVSAINVADGTERYICAGSTYSGGNNSQIRTTDDASKALEIEIKATATNGQFQLYNTAAKATIANNNNNDMYTANSCNFTIAEASQASVNVSIDKNVKYATRIFPFTPTLPSGVKAYSCEASDGDVLTLVEETTLAANTPYILETSVDVNETLEGWGVLASTEAATVGWLTGVYTQTDAPNGSYVLQNNNDKVGFYQVDTNAAQPKVGANRCYLSAAAFAEAREAYFFDEATGVDAIKMLTDGKAAIYNASGTQIPTLQKGMNIIKQGGKTVKVMVK